MKVAIVIPWFGESLSGGAERHAEGLANELKKKGKDVEILTTTGKDSFWDWGKDYYKQDTYVKNGITVRRFSLRKRNKELYDEIYGKILHGQEVSYSEELQLHHETVNSDTLYQYIYDNKDNYKFIFMPYLYGTTYWGLKISPSNSYLIPCLHDEQMAYLKTVKHMFQNCNGIMFNSPEEAELAQRIYDLSRGKYIIAGEGIVSKDGCEERFRKKYNINGKYLIYVGRQVKGKNVHVLLDFFKDLYKENNELSLVLVGKAEQEIAEQISNTPNTIYLGEVCEEDKFDAIKGALALVQPSLMESFSIVIMESWLQGTPVIVHKNCKVTKGHCDRSNGGLYFESSAEFTSVVNKLVRNEDDTREMGKRGKEYVLKNYTWDIVAERIIEYMGI